MVYRTKFHPPLRGEDKPAKKAKGDEEFTDLLELAKAKAIEKLDAAIHAFGKNDRTVKAVYEPVGTKTRVFLKLSKTIIKDTDIKIEFEKVGDYLATLKKDTEAATLEDDFGKLLFDTLLHDKESTWFNNGTKSLKEKWLADNGYPKARTKGHTQSAVDHFAKKENQAEYKKAGNEEVAKMKAHYGIS